MKQFTRNFNKQKTVGLLNICSLSLGSMVAVIVGLWAMNELSFDNFHENRENIYRINEHVMLNGAPVKLGSTFKPLGKVAQDELPQIKEMTRVHPGSEDITVNNTLYPATSLFSADNNFFTFFSFPLKEGSSADVLSAPDKVVISESAALKYFQDKNPVGQSLRIGQNTFTVSGIMKDMPENSSLRSDFVFPFFSWRAADDNWGQSDDHITFFTFHQGTDLRAIGESLKEIIYKNMPFFETLDAKVTLEPMKEMHFSAGFMADLIVKGNKPLVRVFILVALVILVISCINFTNLFISTSFLRAKTIGIKKSYGASKFSLIRDFYLETACYVLISIAAGIFLAQFSLPVFNNFTQSHIQINPLSPQLGAFLLTLFIATVLLAGSFPAWYMTRFNPIETLGRKFRGKNISILQKSLIIVQFTASIALLITVGFMRKQVAFMVNYDLGFDKENVIYVHGRENFTKNYDAFRDELLKNPSIRDITLKNSLPTQWTQGWGISNVGSSESTVMEMNYIKPNYFDFMNMKLIEGENPFYLESSDSIVPAILNESALKALNLESPVGKIIIANGGYTRMEVKGVMRNAHIRSLRDEIDPQVYMKLTWDQWNPVFFKVTGDPQQVIPTIRSKWEELEPDFPFEYHFLDDAYKDLYRSEMNAEKIFAFAMLITFIISIAGLFAMAFYVTQRRIKEIGLRKVNGATLADLLLLLNKGFIKWVLISFVLASVIAYFGLQSWLDGFTVQTKLSIWVFLSVGLLAVLVVLLTTSFQTWNVATMNPVKTLKSE
jgi:putative ABC transport system permease protein